MKKLVACLLLMTGAIGCVTTQPVGAPSSSGIWGAKEAQTKPAEPAKTEKAAPPKPVTPDQVTPANAHKMVDSLQRELEQANGEEK
jgi:hypothetical protein